MVEVATEKVEKAINAIRQGKMVIMVDEEDRENEGDLVFAAEFANAEMINFMVREARGLVCLTLEPQIVDNLKLPMMGDSTKKQPDQGTAFTVSIEARKGVTTGISAADRAKTIQVAIAPEAKPEDLVVPGHIFPLKARGGGILERAGHTEGSVDLAKMAGLGGSAVICEIMNNDGSMARLPDLQEFARKHDLPIIAIADMIKYRLRKDTLINKLKTGDIKTPYGVFRSSLFENTISKEKCIAISKGQNFQDKTVDVRVHHHRPLLDVFGCPDGSSFRLSYGLKMLGDSEAAVFIYLTEQYQDDHFYKDIEWLHPEFESSTAQSKPRKMDDRMLGTGAQILHHLGVRKMRIHTTSSRNLVGISGYGLEVDETKVMANGE